VSGLPPTKAGGARRPLAVLVCSENNANAGTAAAEHLVKDLQVPVVIGPWIAGNEVEVFNKVTFPNGVLNLVYGGGNDALVNGPKGDPILWYTNANQATIMGKAFAVIAPDIETVLRSAPPVGNVPAGSPIKFMMIHKGDGGGKASAEAIARYVKINGKTFAENSADGNFKQHDYGATFDVTKPEGLQAVTQAAANAIDFKPHLIYLFSNAEQTTLQQTIEQGWDTSLTYRPKYINLSGGSQTPQFYAAIGANNDWRQRASGLYYDPGPGNTEWPQWNLRYKAFNNSGDPNKDGSPSVVAAGAYDEYYTAALAIIAAGDQPITSNAISTGIRKLIPARAGEPARQKIYNNPNNLNSLIAAVQGGGVDMEGASGPLDFDAVAPFKLGSGGSCEVDVSMWCVKNDTPGGPATGYKYNGAFMSAATQKTNAAEKPFHCHDSTTIQDAGAD
jgi:hypothetical protein